MKLIFLNRFFHPDISATSQMLSELAFHLCAGGDEVHVITSRQRYDDPAAALPARELSCGVHVHRVWTSRFGRRRLAGRAVDYASFYLSATFRLVRLAGREDIVIAKTDPPLISVPAAFVARIRGARLVNWLQDIFPEIAARAGVGLATGLPGALLGSLRDWSLRSATLNVVLGVRMRDEVLSHAGVPAASLEVIHNWANGDAVAPIARGSSPLRAAWGLAGKFVVAYSGNMGRAHEFGTIVDAAGILRKRDDIAFLFIGDGHHRPRIEADARRRGLANVRFQPYQPGIRLGDSLGAADVHLTCLDPAFEGLLVPSKIYGILAAGRATLHVGHPQGEIARILETAKAGYTVGLGDAASLAARIAELASNPSLLATLGANARAAFDAHFAHWIALEKWTRALHRAAASRPL